MGWDGSRCKMYQTRGSLPLQYKPASDTYHYCSGITRGYDKWSYYIIMTWYIPLTLQKWAVSREKVPNDLSQCHTKERRARVAAPSLLLVWHRLLRIFLKLIFFFMKSRCHTKRRAGAATILLLVWHWFRPLGTFLCDAAQMASQECLDVTHLSISNISHSDRWVIINASDLYLRCSWFLVVSQRLVKSRCKT